MIGSDRRFLLLCCVVMLSLSSYESGWANESTPEKWQFTVAPYVWAVGMNGTVGVKGRTSDIKENFIDVIQDSDSSVALVGNFRAHWGPWTLFVDPTWAKLGNDDQTVRGLKADVTESVTFIEYGGMYRVSKWTLADVPGGTPEWAGQVLSFDLLAGLRYSYVDIEFDFKNGSSSDDSEWWVDPFVGGVIQWYFTEKFSFKLRADFGGFDVGSDVSWHSVSVLNYQVRPFGLDGTFSAGYRVLYQDYTDGGGSNQFEWDMWLHGPIVGLAVTF